MKFSLSFKLKINIKRVNDIFLLEKEYPVDNSYISLIYKEFII